jgi:uncharacterized protein YutE (UPF0331/DUF86 family)
MEYEEARGAVEHAVNTLMDGDEPLEQEQEREAFKKLILVGADALIDIAESLDAIATSRCKN